MTRPSAPVRSWLTVVTSSFTPLTEESLAWAVRPTDAALHRDLEAVLERWRRSGRLQALLQKWLTFHVRG